MLVSLNGASNLKSQFNLIKYYMLRYKLITTTSSAEKSYMPNLSKGEKVFNDLLNRLTSRVSVISNYNKETLLLLFKRKLEYDSEEITTLESEGNYWDVQFSHAILIVLLSNCIVYK